MSASSFLLGGSRREPHGKQQANELDSGQTNENSDIMDMKHRIEAERKYVIQAKRQAILDTFSNERLAKILVTEKSHNQHNVLNVTNSTQPRLDSKKGRRTVESVIKSHLVSRKKSDRNRVHPLFFGCPPVSMQGLLFVAFSQRNQPGIWNVLSSKTKINLVNELVDYTLNEAQRLPEQTLEDLVVNGTILEVNLLLPKPFALLRSSRVLFRPPFPPFTTKR